MTTYIAAKRRYGTASGLLGRLACRFKGHIWTNARIPDNMRAVAGGPSETSELWACDRCDLCEWRTPASYSEADWQADVDHRNAGGDNRPCPQCGRSGFYGPRDDTHGRHYRHCKYCGLLQNVGEEPIQCISTVHDCDDWPRVCGAAYIWWVTPDEATYRCPCCERIMTVNSTRIAGPIENPDHPWASMPNLIDQKISLSHWATEGQPGRVYL